MAKGRGKWRFGATMLALTSALSLTSTSTAAVDVIVHSSVRMDDANRALLRGVFGKRVSAWPDGVPARVFVLADQSPTHERFSRDVLHMYPYQLRQNWDRLIFSGTGQAPTVVPSVRSMIETVANTPGAIGYVDRYDPELFRHRNIRVLNVQ